MEHRTKLVWMLAVALTGLTSWVSGQSGGYTEANVPNREIAAKVGYSANFSCESYGAPISACLWERRPTGDKSPIVINFEPTNARDRQPSSVSGYSYSGDGLDRGSCGIIISIVKDDDNAKWDCTLFSSKGLFRGTVHVNILKKPSPPQFAPDVEQITQLIDPESSSYRGSQRVTITCGSANGQPPPKFRWFIGDRELTREDGLQPYQSSNDSSRNLVTTQALQNYPFSWRDNGKLLKCILDHEGITENDRNEVSQLISVAFVPKAESFDETVLVSSIGETATLTLNVSAHPEPQISWSVTSPTGEQEIIHPEGTSRNGRYKALRIQQIDTGVFECKLVIDLVEEEDLQKVFTLHASNTEGESKFELRVTSSSPSSAGMGAGGIIGLVLGIPALLIIIAVVLVYTRARGLLCFKGKGEDSHSTAHIEGAPSDLGESGNENPTNIPESGGGGGVQGQGQGGGQNMIGGYPPSSTPPLTQSKHNGNSTSPPPAPTIPPPLMDEHELIYNGNGRSVKDSPV